MSLSAKSATKSKTALVSRQLNLEAQEEIEAYLLGGDRPWELSQEEANAIASRREFYRSMSHGAFVQDLMEQGKSKGAIYIASRIKSGADPDLYQLTHDWFAHRNILKELSEEELYKITASPAKLRHLGIQHRWEARAFYELYKEVQNEDRPWGSCYQPLHGKVKALALTPNYRRLPVWVKKAMINSDQWIETERIGNIWRLIDCAKAWKHAPELPKGIAEKVGKMSVKSRILAEWAWSAAAGKYPGLRHSFRCMHRRGWNAYLPEWEDSYRVKRSKIIREFWMELKRLQGMGLAEIILEASEGHHLSEYSLRILAETMMGLPHDFLKVDWDFNDEELTRTEHYLSLISKNGGAESVCIALFGNAGKKTLQLFKQASTDAWLWATAVGEKNADTVQKILGMKNLISYETDAIDFLESLPVQSRLRLLQATTFKYRGQVQPISNDYIRDTGYLWRNIQSKPELGRIRCWFSVHEQLSAAFVKELPDEALPIPAGWEQVDGLCAVNGSWILEFPKRVATLKYYGQVLRNCVGGYGPAIKSGRSIIFVVREQGTLTHCVEVCDRHFNQFYQAGNSSPDRSIKESVRAALHQANLVNIYA